MRRQISWQKLYYIPSVSDVYMHAGRIAARHSRRLRPRNNARGSGTAAAASLITISKDLLIQRRAHEREELRKKRGKRRIGRIGSDRAESERRSIIEGVTSSQGHGSGG